MERIENTLNISIGHCRTDYPVESNYVLRRVFALAHTLVLIGYLVYRFPSNLNG